MENGDVVLPCAACHQPTIHRPRPADSWLMCQLCALRLAQAQSESWRPKLAGSGGMVKWWLSLLAGAVIVIITIVSIRFHEAHEDERIEAQNTEQRLNPTDLECSNRPHNGTGIETALQHALNETTSVEALVLLDRDATTVKLDTAVDDRPQTCNRSLLMRAVGSSRVRHLLDRCRIKTLACSDNDELIQRK